MPITIKRTEFNDFEALQDVVQDNHSDVVQLGRGHMTGAITHMTFDPAFGVSTGHFSLAMRATGILSHSRWCLGFLLKSNGPAFGHHHQFKAGDLAIAAPGEERYIKFQNNTEYVAPFIAPEALERFLAPHPGALEWLHRHPVSCLHIAPATARANIEEMRKVLQALTDEGKAMPDQTVEFYRRSILTMITAPVCNAIHIHYRDAPLVNHDSLLRDIEYYYADVIGPVHVSEICEDFGVHPRTLHRAFHEVVGMGPVAYLRRKRLNDVYTALRKDGPGVTVKKTAIEHGFPDPSRFASMYHRLFGELPSTTLKKQFLRMVPIAILAGTLCLALDQTGLCECPLLAALLPHEHS